MPGVRVRGQVVPNPCQHRARSISRLDATYVPQEAQCGVQRGAAYVPGPLSNCLWGAGCAVASAATISLSEGSGVVNAGERSTSLHSSTQLLLHCCYA